MSTHSVPPRPSRPCPAPEMGDNHDEHLCGARDFVSTIRRRDVAALYLRSLAPKNFEPLALDFGRVLGIVAREVATDRTMGRNYSWAEWKTMSFNGIDVIKNRPVDYGNEEYVTFVAGCCACDAGGEARRAMLLMSQYYGTCGEGHPDTERKLDFVGDLAEIYMASLRGCRSDLFSTGELGWQKVMRFQAFCDVMKSVQELTGHLVSGWVKYRQDSVCSLYKHFPEGGERQRIQRFAFMWKSSSLQVRGALLAYVGRCIESGHRL